MILEADCYHLLSQGSEGCIWQSRHLAVLRLCVSFPTDLQHPSNQAPSVHGGDLELQRVDQSQVPGLP